MSTHPSNRLRVVVTTESRIINREVLLPGTKEGEPAKVGRCDFILNPTEPVEADYWIVFANARPNDAMICAPENTLFIAAEPESKKVYPKKFYQQFHRIVDTHTKSEHPRITLHAPCLSWHVGLNPEPRKFKLTYDDLAAIECPQAPINKVSVVCSNANFTEGQRARLKFLEELKQQLGDKLVHFGRGFEPIDDKLDAILNYRYHLVLENSELPDYWTEKLADAYAGWAFPLYVGCPNLDKYFPKHSYKALSIKAPNEAANTIQSLLSSPRSKDEEDGLREGRRLIMDVYNPWIAWARWAEEFHMDSATPTTVRIRSHKAYRPFPRGLIYRIQH